MTVLTVRQVLNLSSRQLTYQLPNKESRRSQGFAGSEAAKRPLAAESPPLRDVENNFAKDFLAELTDT